MARYLKSGTFWLMFFFVFLAVAVVSLCILMYSWQQSAVDNLTAALRENEQAMNTISEYLDDTLEDAVVLTGTLMNTEWVQKLCVEQGVFDSAFDYVRKREIAGDFLFYVKSNGVVDRRFLVYPYKDIAIGERVYADVSSYLGIIGVPLEKRAALLAEIQGVRAPAILYAADEHLQGGTLLVCLPVEKIARSRVYLCCALNKARLSKGVSSLMPNGVVGVRVTDARGGVLLSLGATAQGEAALVRTASYIDWRYEFFTDERIATVVYTAAQRRPLQAVGPALLVAFLAAGAAALALYQPVAKLVARAGIRAAGGRTVQRDYRALGDHIVTMNMYYSQSRRTAALLRLLSGYFHTGDALLTALPPIFSDGAYYKVLMACGHADARVRDETREGTCAFLSENGIRYEMLDGTEEALIVVMAFHDRETAHAFPAQALKTRLAGRCSLYVGSSARGLTGVGISYQSAKEKRMHLSGAAMSRYYFPLEWESQFLEALFTGASRIAGDILEEVRRENTRRLAAGQIGSEDGYRLLGVLINDVRRVMHETARSGEEDGTLAMLAENENQDDVWAQLVRVCRLQCERVNAARDDVSGRARRLLDYINAHAAESDLSVQSLEEAFSMSAGTMNKCIREECGMTFFAYLTRVRMERAKQLISQGERRVAQVASLVGYDSEYSFRRAFLRYTGMRAQDYGLSSAPDGSAADGAKTEE